MSVLRVRGFAVAVAAQVDSLEHGMGLDPALLTQMAAQGTALTPTLTVINGSLARVLARPDGPRKAWYVGGASGHAQLCAAAGVTVLAGTDSRPTGKIADEIRALAAAGIPPHDALAAGAQLDHPRAVILRGRLLHRTRRSRSEPKARGAALD